MYYDRFDIIEAHYWWNANHHGGQASPEYERMQNWDLLYTVPDCFRL